MSPELDLTSTWIPLGLLAVLGAYMVHLFFQERRESARVAAAEAAEAASAPAQEAAAVTHEAVAAPEPEAAAPAPAVAAESAPAPVVEIKAPKRKASLVWRTAWIWLPFVAGFMGQAWLDIIKPMVEKAGA